MAGMDDYALSMQMRDAIEDIVVKVLDRKRPLYRYARVDEVIEDEQKAMVIFTGEEDPVPVLLGNAEIMKGNFVRISGMHGDRFVDQQPGVEIIPFDQYGELEIAESNNYPARIGGIPFLVVTLKQALTSPATIVLYRNGVEIATETLVAGSLLQTFGPYDEDLDEDGEPDHKFVKWDLARLDITNPGAGGIGFHADLWLG